MTHHVTTIVARIRRSAFPEVVAVSLSLALAAVGSTFALAPGRFNTPTWHPLWAFASPLAWALTCVFVGALSALVVYRWREFSPAPLIVQTTIWGTISALITWGTIDGGVPSAAIIYGLPGWLCLLLVVLYISEARCPTGPAQP